MKKLFYILVVLLSVNLSTAQEAKPVEISNTERIVDKYLGQFKDLGKEVGIIVGNTVEEMGPHVKYGFQIMVRKQYVEPVMSLIVLIISVILICNSYKTITKVGDQCRNKEIDKYDKEDKTVFPTILLCIAAIVFIVSFTIFLFSVEKLIVPEYYAVKEILQLVKTLK